MRTAALTVPWPLHAGNERIAAALLTAYFGPADAGGVPPYSGALFQTLGGPDPDPFRFTALDLVAVSLLSVTVPPPTAITILQTDAHLLGSYLIQIDNSLALPDADDELLEGQRSPLVGIWQTLRDYPGVGRTLASKLLARKRPSLVPIWDSVVAQEYGLRSSQGYWRGLRDQLTANDGELWRRALGLVSEGRLAHRVSPLRAIDVVTWMHGKDPDRSRRLAVQRQRALPTPRAAAD
ncbi:DUF6308 family protein [Kineosporia babensis]|uniref:DUF6308 family protein n=1 Tax=Kineosporia babensis TaxID=499548 RepID=A0A9X1SZE7_9ACTN|nr:DUF6308 family protein [Kineosporia babensis]MCD5311953.1 DUF6308 family protein [Kineosporia babensis]